MEIIPVINFEALNNPSFFSRIFSMFELGKVSYAHRLWKWGAFLLALVYAFNYVANKLKVLIFHYHHKSKSFLANTQPLLSSFDDELYTSDDDDDEDDAVSIASDDDVEWEAEEKEEDEKTKTNAVFTNFSYEDLSTFEDDFTVKGQKRKFKVQRWRKSIGDDFSLSDLVSGDGVVKMWDGFGLGVEKSFPFLELSTDDWKRFGSFFGSPAVVTTAAGVGGGGGAGVLGLSVWDFRCSRSEPAVQAKWRSDLHGRVVGADVNRTGKVCVRDDVTMGMTVGDVRMIETPLTERAEKEEEDMWWDADGVTG